MCTKQEMFNLILSVAENDERIHAVVMSASRTNPNVAKGLWQEEIPYVMDMLNYCVHPQLIRLMEWKIGFDTNFTVSIGKSGKYMYRWLKSETWIYF